MGERRGHIRQQAMASQPGTNAGFRTGRRGSFSWNGVLCFSPGCFLGTCREQETVTVAEENASHAA